MLESREQLSVEEYVSSNRFDNQEFDFKMRI